MKWIIPPKAIYLSLFILSQICIAACREVSKQPLESRPVQSAIIQADSFPQPTGYVNDFERLYTPEQIAYLDQLLANFDDSTTIQMALVTIDSSLTDNQHFDEYTLQLAKNWGVGRKYKNNGIVICISSSLRRMRIQNGNGIEEMLSDDETKIIVDNKFIPHFKKGDYYEGTVNGIQEIISILTKKLLI